MHIHLCGSVGEALPECGEYGGEVHDVVDLVLLDDLLVALPVAHVELLEAARQRHLLVAHITGNYVVFAHLLAESLHQRDTDLALATGNHDLPVMLLDTHGKS